MDDLVHEVLTPPLAACDFDKPLVIVEARPAALQPPRDIDDDGHALNVARAVALDSLPGVMLGSVGRRMSAGDEED